MTRLEVVMFATDVPREWDYAVFEDGFETDMEGTVMADQRDQAHDLAVEDAGERYAIDIA